MRMLARLSCSGSRVGGRLGYRPPLSTPVYGSASSAHGAGGGLRCPLSGPVTGGTTREASAAKESPEGQPPDGRFDGRTLLLAKVVQLITSFRRWGHLAASLDPLGLSKPSRSAQRNLLLESYGFTTEQLASSKPMDVSKAAKHFATGFMSSDRCLPLNQLYKRLREVYASSIGVEYMHIRSQSRRNWLRDRLETVEPHLHSTNERMDALKHLCWSDAFAAFCGTHFRLTKRFGIEGCESLV